MKENVMRLEIAMSKKVKCIDCHNSSHWVLPYRVSEQNYEYQNHVFKLQKQVLYVVKL